MWLDQHLKIEGLSLLKATSYIPKEFSYEEQESKNAKKSS